MATKEESPAGALHGRANGNLKDMEGLGAVGNGQEDEAEAEDEEEGDDDDDDETGSQPTQDGGAKKKKKKKKNRKKKKKSRNQQATAAATAGGKFKPVREQTDEEFAAWAQAALDATAEQVAGVSDEQKTALPLPFATSRFSGSLRPAHVTPQMRIPDHIAKPDYALHPEGRSAVEEAEKQGRVPQIPVHEPEEIAKMREVCAIGREVLDIASRFLRAGVTGDEIDRIVYTACVEREVYPSPLNYYKFPKTLCVSVNECICHGIPDCRPIQEGDIVNLDISVYKDGFHADLNETFFIGEVDEDSRKLVKCAFETLANIVPFIKPGAMYRDLGTVITRTAAQNQCAVVRAYCGHGVGRLFHCAPNVPHYAKNKAVGIMRPGHIFTVEPMVRVCVASVQTLCVRAASMLRSQIPFSHPTAFWPTRAQINLGSNWGDMTWADKWTSTTRDGKRSAQFEHTFLVTETGVEVLTARPGTPRNEIQWDEAAFQR